MWPPAVHHALVEEISCLSYFPSEILPVNTGSRPFKDTNKQKAHFLKTEVSLTLHFTTQGP